MEIVYGAKIVVEHPFASGNFREVLELEVRDYGDNVLWRGTSDSFYPRRCRALGPRPVRLIATKISTDKRPCIGDYTCDYYSEE